MRENIFCGRTGEYLIHNDVIKRKYFPRYWHFVMRIHRSPVDSPHERPVTRSFAVFFDVRLNKRLSKQSRHRWFETPSRSLKLHSNERFSTTSPIATIEQRYIFCEKTNPQITLKPTGCRPIDLCLWYELFNGCDENCLLIYTTDTTL